MGKIEKQAHSRDRALPVSPNTELGASVVPLQTNEGKDSFIKAMRAANGSAVVFVHPFFPERTDELDENPEKRAAYDAYSERLQKSVTRYQEFGIPVVLLEGVRGDDEGATIPDLPGTMQRLNTEGGEIFVAATKDSDPQLVLGDLATVASELKDAGLKRVTVNGSFMVKVSRAGTSVDEGKPKISQKYQFEGCAGRTVEIFSAAGVDARPGGSTFSSEYLEYFYTLQEQINQMQPGNTTEVQIPGTEEFPSDVETRYLGQSEDVYTRYGIVDEEPHLSSKSHEVLEVEE